MKFKHEGMLFCLQSEHSSMDVCELKGILL